MKTKMFGMLLKLSLVLIVFAALVFLFLFALQTTRGSYDCPPGTFPVNTVWTDMETGNKIVNSLCVQNP